MPLTLYKLCILAKIKGALKKKTYLPVVPGLYLGTKVELGSVLQNK